MSMSVCNLVSRTQFTQNPCHARCALRDDLRVFLAVHRGKSFHSASNALGVATSTVARRIEAFERPLGMPLVLSGNGGTAGFGRGKST